MLTIEQEKGIDVCASLKHNCALESFAGTGKTFTLIHIIKEIIKRHSKFIPKRILYLTFSKALQLEAEEKLKGVRIDVKTYHSLAYMPSKMYYCPKGKLNVYEGNLDELINNTLEEELFNPWKVNSEDRAEVKERRDALKSLIHFCKVCLTDYTDEEEVRELANYYGVQVNWDFYNIFDGLKRVMRRCENPTSRYTFDDFMWIMHRMNLKPKFQYDVIIVDEFQDSSAAAMDLIERHLKPNGKIIAVGDPFQAIQTFAGAKIDAFNIGVERFNMEVLPLSVNFRCGKNIIEWAQQIVPGIQAHDGACEGLIEQGKMDDIYNYDDRDEHMIICRINRPLVVPALRMIREGKKAFIKGKDLSKPIVNILTKADKAYDIDSQINIIHELEDAELRKLRKLEERGINVDSKMELITEQHGIAMDVINETGSADKGIRQIQNIFSDDSRIGIAFSSMHRSKGLEAKNVTILESQMMRMPSRPTDPVWASQGEANIDYVARTRAKEYVKLIEGKKKNE